MLNKIGEIHDKVGSIVIWEIIILKANEILTAAAG